MTMAATFPLEVVGGFRPDEETYSYVLPEPRVSAGRLSAQHRAASGAPFVQQIVDGVPDPVVLLNQSRQIVLANEGLATLLGRSRGSLVGQRLGEALDCVHAADEPDGCGTTPFCRFCGAGRAHSLCQSRGKASQGQCRIVKRGNAGALELEVSVKPLAVGGEPLMLVAARDVSAERRREVLERLFFHDVLNTAAGIKGVFDLWPLLTEAEAGEMSERARVLSAQLVEEIQAQRELLDAERGDLVPQPKALAVEPLLAEVRAVYAAHKVARGKGIELRCSEGVAIQADPVLLRRVLGNLVKNALEASEHGEDVTLSFSLEGGSPVFRVHNAGVMPEEVRAQVFQRSFSTKAEAGRGIGTWSVRLLTERYLGGAVSFRSATGEGTTFEVRLPAF
jgi:nitrogen-specific signal transduction histidine kinase